MSFSYLISSYDFSIHLIYLINSFITYLLLIPPAISISLSFLSFQNFLPQVLHSPHMFFLLISILASLILLKFHLKFPRGPLNTYNLKKTPPSHCCITYIIYLVLSLTHIIVFYEFTYVFIQEISKLYIVSELYFEIQICLAICVNKVLLELSHLFRYYF